MIFEGKVALVTGAAGGIGAATARMFAKSNAKVVLTDRLSEVNDVASSIRDTGGIASAYVGSISDAAFCESLVEKTVAEFGRLDFAFNNAGIGGSTADVAELDLEVWRRVIDVNLNGVFYGTKYQIPAMRESGGGVIVNTSSVLGLKPIKGSSLEYTAAKHGVIGLTRQVAVNYGGQGIRCVAVCPGFIETPLVSDQEVGWFINRTPLGRAGQPDDIAGVVRLLCSDDASFINGACLEVDGGFVLA